MRGIISAANGYGFRAVALLLSNVIVDKHLAHDPDCPVPLSTPAQRLIHLNSLWLNVALHNFVAHLLQYQRFVLFREYLIHDKLRTRVAKGEHEIAVVGVVRGQGGNQPVIRGKIKVFSGEGGKITVLLHLLLLVLMLLVTLLLFLLFFMHFLKFLTGFISCNTSIDLPEHLFFIYLVLLAADGTAPPLGYVGV